MYRLVVYGSRVYDLKVESEDEAERLARQIVKNSHPLRSWAVQKIRGRGADGQ